MTSPLRPRSTRDRPAKPPLSIDAIVGAALAVLRSEGLPALSMRRVATALDTAAGSLYVYVSGRDELLRAVFDRIVAAVELETPDASQWRSQLHSLLERMRDALVECPGIAAATMIDPPRTEVALGLLENLLGILLAGGFAAQDAAWTADILAAQVTYSVIESEARHVDTDALAKKVTATFAGLPPERFPLITEHTAELVAGDDGERFSFAIDVVLDGVIARSAGA